MSAPRFRVEYTNNSDFNASPPFLEYWTKNDAKDGWDELAASHEFLWLIEWGVRADTGKQDWICTYWSKNTWEEDPTDLQKNEGWAKKHSLWNARTFFEPAERRT